MEHQGLHIFGRPIGVVAIVAYKALWGLTECAAGTVLALSGVLISGELAEDPQDLFIGWLVRGAHFNPTTAAHVGVFFLFLGSIKLIVALGVWFSSWAVRRALLVFLSVVTMYAIIELATRVSTLKVIALLSDLAVLFYIWKLLPRHLRRDGIR